jgi:hypothetical protein
LLATATVNSAVASTDQTITYKLKTPGNVSLAIYNAGGRQVREVLRAVPQTAGKHTAAWDGLDHNGQPLPEGKYTWKMLQSQGLEAEYLMTLGTSVGINAWPGVHGGPSAAIVSGDRMYMSGAGSETAMGIACSKLDGTFVWSNHGLSGWDSQFDLAIVGDKLWGQFPGDGSTRAASITNGADLKLSMTHRIPLLALTLQGDAQTPAPVGFTAFPVAAYTPERGYGWQAISNVTAFTREAGDRLERGGHQMSGLSTGTKPVFLVDLPKYVVYPGSQYSVRLHLGGGAASTQDCDTVHITAQGNGKGTWKRDASPKADIITFTVNEINKPLEIGFNTDQKDKTFGVSLRGIEIFALPNRMDADEKQMVIAAAGASKLLWVKPEEDEAVVANMEDVALLGDGSVLAISGDRLVTLSRKAKTPVVRVTGLEKPAFLAVDKSNGDILVAQMGDSNQILRFDRNFKKIATYGRAGGRKNGRYVPEDFAGISGVASDHQGGFLVTEWMSAPRRVAHFDKAGKLLREWYGGQMFYHSVGVDPEDPSRVWENSQFGNVMEMEVDYDKREWKVVSTWNLDSVLNRELFPGAGGFWALVRPITLMQNGKRERYVGMEGASATVLKPDYENGRLVPVAAAGSVQRGAKLGSVAPPEGHPWRVAAERLMKEKGAPQSLLHYIAFGYVDANGDGQMQPEEFTIWGNRGQHGWGWVDIRNGGIIDADLNSWCFENSSWYRLVPTGLAPNGLPIWDMGKREVGPTLKGATIASLWPTTNAVYTLERRDGDDFGRWWALTYWEGHGYGWPGSMVNATALVRRDRSGTNIVWESGPHHSGGPGARGRLDMPTKIAGIVNGCIGVANQTRQPCEFWTEDGLYVGGLFDRRKADGLPDRIYSWWCVDPEKGPEKPDNRALLNYDMGYSGVLAKRPNGDVLFYGAGWNNVPVFRINGWDQFVRQSGTVKLKRAAKTVNQGTGLAAEYFANPDLKGEPTTRRVDADVWFGYANKAKANGSKIPWPEPEITGKPFSVRWAGFVEPRFSEETTFVFYARNSGVRLWIGDQLVIDQWDGGEKKAFGKPVQLEAGKKVPIKIEWRQLKPDPQAHLNWESLSQPISHVPTNCLYAK